MLSCREPLKLILYHGCNVVGLFNHMTRWTAVSMMAWRRMRPYLGCCRNLHNM